MDKELKIEYVNINDLVPYSKNMNKHTPEQIDRLIKLIEYQSFRDPLIVQKGTNIIAAGHGRWEAAKKMGIKEVPVTFQEFENEAQFYAFVVSHNAINSNNWGGGLDLGQINQDFLDLGPELDIEMLGIKDFVIEPIEKLDPLTDEDEVPEVAQPITRRGDIWLLGNHRLMCGDSTMIDDVEKLMNGEKADITFTSPPYNAGKNVRGNFYKENSDDKTEDDYTEFLNLFTSNCLTVSKYVFVNIQILESNKRSIVKYQYDNIDSLKDVLIWNKRQYPPHINKGTFGCKWEYVFAFGENYKSRSFPCSWQGKYSNVIDTENNSSNEFADSHKAGFPVSFPVWLIEKMDFAKKCYDPFMGTGTTMIACEKLNLGSFGMELSEEYCDISINRWQKYTGKKAILEQSGEFYDDIKSRNI